MNDWDSGMPEESSFAVFAMLLIPSLIGAVAYWMVGRLRLTPDHLYGVVALYAMSTFASYYSPGIVVGGACFTLAAVASVIGAWGRKKLLARRGGSKGDSPYRVVLCATLISLGIGLNINDWAQQCMGVDGGPLVLFYIAALVISPSLAPFFLLLKPNVRRDSL